MASLPPIDALVDAPPAAVAEFRQKGHALVRGACSAAEVAAYRPVLCDAARARNPEPPPLQQRDTYGKAFIQSMNLWRLDDDAKAFVWSPRFARLAAQLLEVEGVRLYHDQALFKEAGGGPTPWHLDQVYWPLDTDRTITMWMPLVDVPTEVGSMTFASGSHASPDLGAFDISEASDLSVSVMVAERGLALHTYGAMAAGDATFHSGRTLHRAGGNPTSTTREVMTVIWYADGARVTEPANPYQAHDLKVWLNGIAPGQLAGGPRNPRLWPPVEVVD
ncbi:MAG: phytanoyl-CoA dioxygenase family protein [Acidimicrobiales bacterium]